MQNQHTTLSFDSHARLCVSVSLSATNTPFAAKIASARDSIIVDLR